MPNTSSPDPEDSEFRIDGPRFAAAIETAPERDFPGASPELRLAGFRKTIVTKSKVELLDEDPVTGRYTDRNGHVIERKFAGTASVDGRVVDFAQWPLAGSKWVNQPTNDSPLTISDGQCKRTYHFDTWTISDDESGQNSGRKPTNVSEFK